jgi:hypothetical protein
MEQCRYEESQIILRSWYLTETRDRYRNTIVDDDDIDRPASIGAGDREQAPYEKEHLHWFGTQSF